MTTILARFDFADDPAADDIERDGFGGKHRTTVDITKNQRPDARADRGRRSASFSDRATNA